MHTPKRREAIKKARARARRLLQILKLRWISAPEPEENQRHQEELWVRHMAKNRKNCSCHMCRNPRHSTFTKGAKRWTLQEQKANIAEQQAIAEITGQAA